MRSSRLTPYAVAVLLLLSSARPSLAIERETELSGAARGSPGLASLEVSVLSGRPDSLGVSAQLRAIRVVDLDAGIAFSLDGSRTAYFRAGPRWVVHDGRRGGEGAVLTVGPLAGARWRTDDFVGQLGLNAVAACSATYWLHQGLGLSLRLIAGVSAMGDLEERRAVKQNLAARVEWPLIVVTPDLRLGAGLAF